MCGYAANWEYKRMNDSQGYDPVEKADEPLVFWDEVWTLDDEWHPNPMATAETGRPSRDRSASDSTDLATARSAIAQIDLRKPAAL